MQYDGISRKVAEFGLKHSVTAGNDIVAIGKFFFNNPPREDDCFDDTHYQVCRKGDKLEVWASGRNLNDIVHPLLKGK